MTCCGRDMAWQGDKWVCGKCGGFFIPGFAAALLPVGVAI